LARLRPEQRCQALITTDRLGRVTYMNSAAEGLTGLHQHLAKNRPLAEVFTLINSETGRPIDSAVSNPFSSHTPTIHQPYTNHTPTIHQPQHSSREAVRISPSSTRRRRSTTKMAITTAMSSPLGCVPNPRLTLFIQIHPLSFPMPVSDLPLCCLWKGWIIFGYHSLP
jgi:PAS domain-containing protein